MLIGREKEKNELLDAFHSNASEFVAIYGRRRVGKTYLIRETFDYQFAFQHTAYLTLLSKNNLRSLGSRFIIWE